MGTLTGELSTRRGQVSGTEVAPGGRVSINGKVPLAEMSDFQPKLKSVTGGQGTFSLELSHYEAVPGQVQKQLVSEFSKEKEED